VDDEAPGNAERRSRICDLLSRNQIISDVLEDCVRNACRRNFKSKLDNFRSSVKEHRLKGKVDTEGPVYKVKCGILFDVSFCLFFFFSFFLERRNLTTFFILFSILFLVDSRSQSQGNELGGTSAGAVEAVSTSRCCDNWATKRDARRYCDRWIFPWKR
jgi:hypothetical protein